MSGATTKPTIIIISGAFHTPASYAKLVGALSASGFEVHVPRLPTCNGARPPNAGLPDDTSLIRGYVESLVTAGRTVVAIGHSYGGHVMSNALYGLGLDTRSSQNLKGGVSHLVYMAGFLLPEDTATVDKYLEPKAAVEGSVQSFDTAEDGTIVLQQGHVSLGLEGPSIGQEDITAYLGTLCRWHGQGMWQKSENAAWKEIPVAYIHTTADQSIPAQMQQDMIKAVERDPEFRENTGGDVQIFNLATGHCPHFTATEEVVDAIKKVVSA